MMKLSGICCFFILMQISCLAYNAAQPILILADRQNFGTYTGEILKAEGFNEFKIESLSYLGTSPLKRYDIVILAEKELSKAQAIILRQYVKEGGNLIAFSPDSLIAPLFGLISTGRTLAEGYIQIDTADVIGRGLVQDPIQYHGVSKLYKLKGGEKVATLCTDKGNLTKYPSLVLNRNGKGFAAAFSYNLPQSIAYTRQGNPEWAGQERDQVDGPTATDLFYPFKGQKQWNDPSKIAIPQADEQMRLLTHLIEYMSSGKRPLPRFWYFPEMFKCIFIFTIDGEDSKETDIDAEIKDVQSKGGNATLYQIGTYIKPETVGKWRLNGNEVAIHFNDVPNYANPTFQNMKTVIDTMTAQFKKSYGYVPSTTRNHWVVWVSKDYLGHPEFVQQAELEADYGVGLDCNYYQFGGNKVYPNWLGDVGHITGSGLPMKFVKSNGWILNIYQSNTQLPDETWLKENIESKSKTLIDRSLDQENYAWINANYHTWYWKDCREPGLRVLDYCNQRNVPIWSAEKAYHFLQMKDEASFDQINWKDNVLSFVVKSNLKVVNQLTVMVPLRFGNLRVQKAAVNKKYQSFTIRAIKGTYYLLIPVKTGENSSLSFYFK